MLHPWQAWASEAVGVWIVPEVAQSSLWFLCAEACSLYCPLNEGGPCNPCASTVVPWDPLTSGDECWPGDLLAPAVCCDGLQGTGAGQCLWDTVPCGEGMWHPLVPRLCVARTVTAVNEPPFSLWRRVSWGCWAEGKGVAHVLCPMACQQLPRSTLILGQIRIRDPNQGGKDITEEIMSGARTSSTPTPPQVSGPS